MRRLAIGAALIVGGLAFGDYLLWPFYAETVRNEAASRIAAAQEDQLAKWHAVNQRFYALLFRQRILTLAKDLHWDQEADFDGTTHIKRLSDEEVSFWLATARLSGTIEDPRVSPSAEFHEYLANFYARRSHVELAPRWDGSHVEITPRWDGLAGAIIINNAQVKDPVGRKDH